MTEQTTIKELKKELMQDYKNVSSDVKILIENKLKRLYKLK